MSSWSSHQIADLGTVYTGSTPSTADDSLWGGDIPFVTPGELDKIEPITKAERTLSPIGGSVARMLPEGAVLVCCIGSLGKVGIAGRPLASNQQINAIVFNKDMVWPRYGFHACRLLKGKLVGMAPATTVAIVSKSKFERLSIPLPPLPEQHRIAAILDQAEALRTKRRAALAKIDTLAQSIFIEMFGDTVTNPQKIPISLLGPLILDGPQNGLYKPSELYGEGTPILRIDGFYAGEVTGFATLKRLNISSQEVKTYGLRANDIVVNRVNSPEYLGKCALIPELTEPTVFESNMMRFSVDEARLNPRYLVSALQGASIRAQIQGCAKHAINQSSINQKDVVGFQIQVPNIMYQLQFAERMTGIANLIAQYQRHLTRLNGLFASLQHRAFQGEL